MSSKEVPPRSHYEPVTIRSAADLRAVLSLGSSLMITTRRRLPVLDTESGSSRDSAPATDPGHREQQRNRSG